MNLWLVKVKAAEDCRTPGRYRVFNRRQKFVLECGSPLPLSIWLTTPLRTFLPVTILVLFCLTLTACNQPRSGSTSPAAASTNRQVYPARGVVREFLSPTRAKIEHEAITNYMEAMTMPFDVKNANEFAGIKVGDKIAFDLVVTPDDGWMEHIKRIGEAPAPVAVTGDTNQGVSFRKAAAVEPISIGDKMPDYSFVTEDGKKIRLSNFKGQALGFTFIFTRCPFPTFCPRMTSNFERIAAELSKAGNPTNWHLLSISFDPEYDTPERLKEHAKRFQRDPAKWNFCTGERADIEAIAEQLGLIFATRNGTIEHNLRTVIVDANGRVRQIFIGNDWPTTDFIDEMKKAAAGEPIPKPE